MQVFALSPQSLEQQEKEAAEILQVKLAFCVLCMHELVPTLTVQLGILSVRQCSKLTCSGIMHASHLALTLSISCYHNTCILGRLSNFRATFDLLLSTNQLVAYTSQLKSTKPHNRTINLLQATNQPEVDPCMPALSGVWV